MASPADSDATVVERRRSGEHAALRGEAATVASPSDPGSDATRRLTAATTVDTLRAEEVVRTRTFLYVEMLLVAIIAPLTFALGGDATLRLLFVASCGLIVATNSWSLLRMRNQDWYSPIRILPAATAGILTACTGCYYFGLYSPAPMIFTLGLYFFSLGSSRGVAATAYAICAAFLAAGMTGLTLGVLPDDGLIRAGDTTITQQLVSAFLVQVVLLVTFVFARMSRRATTAAVQGLEHALRQVNQREALLQEMNVDLDRALRGGGHGRWSHSQVGPWKLGNVIGRGAMGEVYAATHESRALPAAVKLLMPDVERDATQLRRFLREAEVMSRLDSPHVVRVHDVGTGPTPYIAMELLQGHDLAWHLRKRRRLPPARVQELVGQVAGVLEQARERDIVHRDLKPQNLFLAEEDGIKRWKVLDFGVSKIGVESGTLTRGHVIGTPGYMAPEQARGTAIDHRADVFSLAAIVYRALTGRPAFAGDDYPKILHDIVYRQPTRPGEHVGLPDDVDLVLALALAKDPERRFRIAADFARAFADALDHRLDGGLRARAAKLLAEHPWGEAIR